MTWTPIAPLPLAIVLIVMGLAATGCAILVLRRPQPGAPGRLTWGRRLAVAVLVAIMALGPSFPGGKTRVATAALDVMFAVDTTQSMGAIDYHGAPNAVRLDGVRADVLAIAAKLPGARFSLVTFDATANVVMPFTTDTAALSSAVGTMTQQTYNTSSGSSIDLAIPVVQHQLAQSRAQHPDNGRLLFYFGDGEQTATTPVQSFAPLKSLVDGGGVLGYGTAAGAKILKYAGFPGYQFPDGPYLMDGRTNPPAPAISKMDAGNLQTIAAQLGVSYQNRNDGGPVTRVVLGSGAQRLIDSSREVGTFWRAYWVIAIAVMWLLLWECVALLPRLRVLRRTR